LAQSRLAESCQRSISVCLIPFTDLDRRMQPIELQHSVIRKQAH